MSHEIDMSNNRANMAYVGKVPWHELGQQINPDSPGSNGRSIAHLCNTSQRATTPSSR